MTKINFTSEIGLGVWKDDWVGAEWTITGNPKQDMTIKQFESAYDFEEYIQKKVNCSNITFDSEYCQFFAYAKTKQRATSFAKAIDKHFIKVRELAN